MDSKTILAGLTTTSGSDWRAKIREIDRLGIREVALFPTCLESGERDELYRRLEETKLESIPHVHLRGEDMPPHEIDFLVNRYRVKVFNIHSPAEFPVHFDYSRFAGRIYVENTGFVPTPGELADFAGLCVDFAHWESGVLTKNPKYRDFRSLVERFPVGCCHVSALSGTPVESHDGPSYDNHWLSDFSALDYLRKYVRYFPDVVSIELENPFAEQVEVMRFLTDLIEAGPHG
jgi:hypothetical protein